MAAPPPSCATGQAGLAGPKRQPWARRKLNSADHARKTNSRLPEKWPHPPPRFRSSASATIVPPRRMDRRPTPVPRPVQFPRSWPTFFHRFARSRAINSHASDPAPSPPSPHRRNARPDPWPAAGSARIAGWQADARFDSTVPQGKRVDSTTPGGSAREKAARPSAFPTKCSPTSRGRSGRRSDPSLRTVPDSRRAPCRESRRSGRRRRAYR